MNTPEKIDTLPTMFNVLLTRRYILSFENLDCPSYLVQTVHLPPITKERLGYVQVCTLADGNMNTVQNFIDAIESETPVGLVLKYLDQEGIPLHILRYENAILETCELGTLTYEDDANLVKYNLCFKVGNPTTQY